MRVVGANFALPPLASTQHQDASDKNYFHALPQIFRGADRRVTAPGASVAALVFQARALLWHYCRSFRLQCSISAPACHKHPTVK
jgi:hypothetical protein